MDIEDRIANRLLEQLGSCFDSNHLLVITDNTYLLSEFIPRFFYRIQ